jgi:probable DNA metabolism protein
MNDLFGNDELSRLPEGAGSSPAALRETDRMTGLLRFSRGAGGTYLARCAPEYFILPALAEHFTARFGETPWAIIDEKRNIALLRLDGDDARLEPLSRELTERLFPGGGTPPDGWEDLWKLYHRSVNIENRKNPACQRQFMPLRYWKYLPETEKK